MYSVIKMLGLIGCSDTVMTQFPRSRVLPEKLTSPQLVKKFPAFYGTQRFITTFTTACHLSLSSARVIQSMPPHQGQIKLLGAPRQWKHFRPLFQAVFLSGGGITPQTESNTTPPSSKTEITNILFYTLNLWLRIYCSSLRGCDMHEKEIVIWPCWCFMADIIFTLLSLLLCL